MYLPSWVRKQVSNIIKRGYRKITLRFNFENARRYMPTKCWSLVLTI